MEPANNSVQIELRVPDFEKVKDFYGKLGFEIVWERKPEEKKGYLVIKRDNNVLCIWPGNELLNNNHILKTFRVIQNAGMALKLQ